MKKRLTALFMALSMMISLAACSNNEETIPYTFNEVLTMLADDTNVDELMDVGNKVEISDAEAVTEQDFMASVEKLEEYMAIVNELTALNIAPATESTDGIIELYSNLSADDAQLLIDSYNAKEGTAIEKARIAAGLAYINTDYQTWIKENGLNISEELLKRIIKAAACEASGLEIEYYDSCRISEKVYSANPENIGTVDVNDPISGSTLSYEIPYDSSVMQNATELLYRIQSAKSEEEFSTIGSLCNEALYTSKLAIAAGVAVADGTAITSAKSEKDAKKLILERDDVLSTQEG